MAPKATEKSAKMALKRDYKVKQGRGNGKAPHSARTSVPSSGPSASANRVTKRKDTTSKASRSGNGGNKAAPPDTNTPSTPAVGASAEDVAAQDASAPHDPTHPPDPAGSKLASDKGMGSLESTLAGEGGGASMGDAPPAASTVSPGANQTNASSSRMPAKGGMKKPTSASKGGQPGLDPTVDRVSVKDPAPYSLRMADAWTVHDGTFEPMPLDKRRKRDVPYPTYVNRTFNAMNALSGLQLSHNAPIPLTALDIANEHLWGCMPRGARRYLYLVPPNGPALWGSCEVSAKAMYEKMDEEAYQVPKRNDSTEMEYSGFVGMKRQPWIIWPLWIEDEWGSDYVTVIWYSVAASENDIYYDQVEAYAIIDPRRSPVADADHRHRPIKERIERIQSRLCQFWDKAGIRYESAKVMDVRCSPMPFHEATSGERCFAVVKGLMNQITEWFLKGKKFCPKTTITSMSQWVHPFQQRIELTGINAWILMASMDYNARISVEAISPDTHTEVVADGEKTALYNYDLAGPLQQPPIAPWDYCLPANGQYRPPTQAKQEAGMETT